MATDAEPLLGPEALPLYLRLADRIHQDVYASEGGAGARLPSERRLAERYGASRVTVRAALGELRERGIVVSLPARGWALSPSPAGPAAPAGVPTAAAAGRVLGFADLAAQRGLRMRSHVLSTTVRPTTTGEAERLRTVAGAELFEMRRVRYLNDLAIALEHNRVPLALAPGLPDVDFTDHSLYDVLRGADPPRLPRCADYSVEARNPTDEERERLDIDGWIPVLAATQLTFGQDATPLELTVQAYRGDRYTFQASITD